MSANTLDLEDSVSRRAFLKTTAAISGGLAGGLVLSLALPGCGNKPAVSGETKFTTPNAWLRIGTDNSITFFCDRSEMGQGVYTALPMLLAEELGVTLQQIKVEFAPPGDAYINNLIGGQITGGSTSVRDGWDKLRKAGATARHLLVTAAANEWGVSPGTCKVAEGVIISPRFKKLTFGEVAEAAAKLPVPADVRLKPADQFTLIGKPQRRKDTPSKVDGSAVYGIDVKLPGMLYAALAQSPTLGGTVKTFNDEKARNMPGVVAAMLTSSGVAVVADSWWRAKKARDALAIEWEAGPNAGLNDAKIAQTLRQGAAGEGRVARNDGDVAAAIQSAQRSGRVVRAEYELPLLAHATLEPQNCTADVRADGADIYVPTQVQQIAQAAAAKAAGLDAAQVKVHTTFLGGGFGRRLETDFIPAAVELSKALKKPVKVLWTREDDMTHDAYRPPAFDQATAAFDAKGKLTAWQLHLTGPSITARMFPAAVEKIVDPFAVEAAANYPYDVPNVRVDFKQQEIGINVGYWRSVSHALNCFVAESFMDELAYTQRKGPAEFRRALLEKQPRFLKVLDLVTHEARFGFPPRGHAQGLAVMEGYGTYMAQVADITIGNDGKVKVHRVYCAADCGQQVNPDTVVAQIESSILFGYSALMWGEINLKGGRVQQTNFDGYRVARMNDAPRVDAYVIDSTEAPGGIGEPATALVAPAVCNAIFSGTGRRLRSLPLARHRMA